MVEVQLLLCWYIVIYLTYILNSIYILYIFCFCFQFMSEVFTDKHAFVKEGDCVVRQRTGVQRIGKDQSRGK